MFKKDKEEDDESSVKWKYAGREEEWESFDRRVARRMLKKFDEFGERMWLGEIPNIPDLDENGYEFYDYVSSVYRAIEVQDRVTAMSLLLHDWKWFLDQRLAH